MELKFSKWWIIPILMIGLVGFGLATSFWETLAHLEQRVGNIVALFIEILLVMALVWLVSAIRDHPVFDKRGTAGEMLQIQSRIGTEREGPRDALAVAIKHFATTMLIVIALAALILDT